MRSTCTNGGEHNIVSPDDRGRYDPSVLARYDTAYGPRPDMLWSYCATCKKTFRWSVHDQQWRLWPGGLGLLPHLSDEELDELGVAVELRKQQLGEFAGAAQSTDTRQAMHYKLRILQSLSTAIAEARYQLWPPEGDYKLRAWGEAWKALEQWVEVQLAGIARSSQNDMTEAATAAFRAVEAKIMELWKGTRP